ncbi:MAG: transcription antitermination factor NusB [Candidatus Lloydbacteria bacterium RIFCSPHIGHO2_02_FULL_51_22]|uniref:Transcription antitermination protein NusB n=2 Tax=Candidatus Lloydiibacteriota TaxID=1817910 RepID=A0A1G2DFQ3_9BACT|nr:MAG: transcription antitermination factor NusB [Candidatus Lloydbacteria bacterium RIFCSPHIGHO2_02_FULL_51_22]
MSSRHLARSIVMQTLFEWDFNGCHDAKIEEILERNLLEFAPGEGDFSFTKNLTKNILKKRKAIDAIIEKAAPEWPIDKISLIDRNVLRIGLFELLFADRGEVPPKVAINEAIELAKTFSGDTGGKFVNGVLGAVYRELGEPGKEDVGRKFDAKKKNLVDITKLPLERLGGAVVYAKKGGKIYLALVHDIFAHWTLSKGKLEGDESEEEGTIRELKEEIGVDITIKKKIGENEYIASDPERGKIRKHVSYFLAETPYKELTLGTSGGLDDARWFPLEDVPELALYDDVIPLVTKGIKMIPK